MSSPAHAGTAHVLSTAADLSTGHVLVQMVVALAIVLGAVWVLAKLAKRTRRLADRVPAAAARGGGRDRLRAGGSALWRAARAQFARRGAAPARVKRVPAPRRRPVSPWPEVTIASRKPVGRGKSIALVDVGCRRFLVGISESGFTQLGEVPREERAAQAEHVPAPAADARQGDIDASAPAASAPAGVAPTVSVAAWLDALREGSVAR